MSTVVVATVKSNSSSPPTFQNTSGTEIGRLCRAWVNFDGTGTVAIRAQYNVSSITDNGVGDYTVNFTTAMPDATYAVITGATGAWGTNNTARSIGISSTTAPTASAVRIVNIGTGSAEDTSYEQIAIFR